MRRYLSMFNILLLAFALCNVAFADEPRQTEATKETEPPAEAQGGAKPGPEHKQLHRLVGEWDCVVVTYVPGSDEGTEAKAKAKITSIMGGLFIQQNFQGEMEGTKFRGRGVSGYDTTRKKFIGTWIDSMSTNIMTTEGEYDEKTHSLTEIGKTVFPEGAMTLKMVSQYESNDKFTMTMHMVQGDDEIKMMEIHYTRKKEK